MNIVEFVEYDLISIFLSILGVLHYWAPIVLLVFIARVVWLIYKLEKRKNNEN